MTSNRRFPRFLACASLLAAFAACSTAWAQVAGRVLVAVGSVSIERDGQRLPATVGAEVRKGDLLQLGEKSNAQVRLQDGSIFALRPDTSFRINEFQFVAGDDNQQRAFFDLIKGGVRTVTGVIGRANRKDDYRVTTATSTIGIRGTHYSLVACADSCRNADGSFAPNGTYGAVTDGRISSTNQSGEQVFGADQYFHVASASAAATQLLAPPPFVRDRLEGRASRQTQQQPGTQSGQQAAASGGESATTVAQTGMGATTGDTGISGSVSSSAPAVLPSTATLNAFITNEAQSTSGVPATLQTGLTGNVFYRLAAPYSIPTSCSDGLPCGNITLGDIVLAVNFTLQRAYARLALGGPDGGRVNFGTPFTSDGMPITINGGQVSFGQTFLAADYPGQQGAFRCSNCGPGDTAGTLTGVSLNGSISGGSLTLNVGIIEPTNTQSFSTTLTQATPPNSDVAAIVMPRAAPAPVSVRDPRSESYWNVTLDGARQVTSIGPSTGAIAASIGSATNVTMGSNAAAGNLVWGYWDGAGAQVTDFNYNTFTTSAAMRMPWISGTAINTWPQALGTVSYSLVGGLVNPGGFGTLNSGALTADFVNRTVSVSLNATYGGPAGGPGWIFQMNGTSGVSPVNGRFSAAFGTVSCTGACLGSAPTGQFAGFFSGANAEGAGVAFNATTGSGLGVNGVAAFKR